VPVDEPRQLGKTFLGVVMTRPARRERAGLLDRDVIDEEDPGVENFAFEAGCKSLCRDKAFSIRPILCGNLLKAAHRCTRQRDQADQRSAKQYGDGAESGASGDGLAYSSLIGDPRGNFRADCRRGGTQAAAR